MQSWGADLRQIRHAEARLPEVAIITKEKAPELIAEFNQACLDSGRAMARIHKELNEAKRLADRRAANVRLSLTNDYLEERGLNNSKDVRDACVAADEEYNEILEKIEFLNAMYMLWQTKAKAFDRAYQAIKKLIDPYSDTLDRRASISAEPQRDDEPGSNIGRPRHAR